MKILALFRPATIVGTLPNTIANGQTADAVPLMADLNWIVNQVNANAAELSLTPQLANANTFTAVQSGVAATSAANFPIASQVQNASLITLSSVAGNNTITGRVSGFTLTGYTRGQIFSFVPAAGNSGSATINIDAVGATTIFKEGGRTLSSDDLAAGKTAIIRYRTPIDGLASGFDLLNPGFTISGGAYRNAGDILIGTGLTSTVQTGMMSTLPIGSSLQLPFVSTPVATRIVWLSINQLPMASSIDTTNDTKLIFSQNLGTNARAAIGGMQEFLASGTWTAAAGVTTAWVTACAAGGGGGGSSINSDCIGGAGAAGDGTLREKVTPVPGTAYTVTVGAGGTAGSTAGGNGGTGGTTSLGALVSLAGGNGGIGGTTAGRKNDGAKSTNRFTLKALEGTTPANRYAPGSLIFGVGVEDVGANNTAGTAGTANTGSGGTGAHSFTNDAGLAGGVGGSGIVMVEW